MHNTRQKARAIAIARTIDERNRTLIARHFLVASGAIAALSLLAMGLLP